MVILSFAVQFLISLSFYRFQSHQIPCLSHHFAPHDSVGCLKLSVDFSPDYFGSSNFGGGFKSGVFFLVICLPSILLYFLTVFAFAHVGVSLFLLETKRVFILQCLTRYKACMARLFCMHVQLSSVFYLPDTAIWISTISCALNVHVKSAHSLSCCWPLIVFNVFIEFFYALDLYI